ncbi:MAG TPA: SOS response-associated peptidase [Pirellulales bacterium]|nr:SOS response-associated peptidase [Pirellulales bacterium]
MCGRYTLRTKLNQALQDWAVLTRDLAWEACYNIAPTDQVPIVRLENGIRTASLARWGLIPPWVDDPARSPPLINARADTVADKPAFRTSFQQSRCLVPADGFYEWKKTGKTKQKYFIHRTDDQPLAFAGLFRRARCGERFVDSCCIITTDANSLMNPLHDRMPAILSPGQFDRWLDPEFQAKDQLLSMLRPCDDAMLYAYAAQNHGGNVREQGDQCIAPIAAG